MSAFECSSHTQLKALPRAGWRPCAGAECVHGSWIGRAWTDRGRVVEQAAFEPPLEDPESVIGQSWRGNLHVGVGSVRQQPRRFPGRFAPRGNPPAGGWPVVSLAHGTTGVEPGCGPATEPSLGGYLPTVRAFLEEGYAVAFTDYEGLGRPGIHPYLEPRTVGR